MWLLILQRQICGNWTKKGGSELSVKIHNFPSDKNYLECAVTTLLIISVPEIGRGNITLVHLYKEGCSVCRSAY